jgi:GT2 family glycosyltransferase
MDTRKRGEVEWVVGAAMLLRREAVEEVEGFDTSFFMYDEEVDLAFRLRQRGWDVLYYPHAEFVHVGGGSTRQRPREMYREQLRSHIRFLDKHQGRESAERGLRLLRHAMRLRTLVLWGQRRRLSADAARWLAEWEVEQLVARPPANTKAPATDAPVPADRPTGDYGSAP